jgi:hypothetical protein
MKTLRIIRSMVTVGILLAAAGGGIYTWRALSGNQTIERLLTENTELKQAITHLSEETQIGYAKLLSQETRGGQLFTRLLFVETRPNEPLQPVSKKEYEIQGDVVHFDALIVKFDAQLVMDGKERALYLWRRIYGEHMAPESGPAINEQGMEPARYEQLCSKLSLSDRRLFWDNIWGLANDPNRLASLGVRAIYGNVVYHKLKPGLIYVFKIDSTGSVYPEIVPDL